MKLLQFAIFCALPLCAKGQMGSCSMEQTAATGECLKGLKENLVHLKWAVLCGKDYFRECRQVIRGELSSCVTEEELKWTVENLEAEIDGGISYLCVNRLALQDEWRNMGPNCSFHETAYVCGLPNLMYYPKVPSNAVQECRLKDGIVLCVIQRLGSSCPESDIPRLITEFYQSVLQFSPCRSSSVFFSGTQARARPLIGLTLTSVTLLIFQAISGSTN